jgi:hypothetical protein
VARASHYYPSTTSVTIIVRENQSPCDEYISLLFEVLNSQGESRFQQLVEMAKAGAISRREYATEVLKQEFVATKNARDLIGNLGFGNKEIEESYFYNRLIKCPDEFEGFIPYLKKVSPQRGDPYEGYEKFYDLQKQYYDSQSSKNGTTNVDPAPTLKR